VPRRPREPTRGMLLPSTLLVLACLLVGIFPEYTVGPVLASAARSILGEHLPAYELAVWHGATAPLLMSVVALAGGLGFYIGLHRRGRTMMPTPWLSRLNAAKTFDLLNVTAIRGAARVTRGLFSVPLQPQLLLIVCAAFGAGYLPLAIAGWSAGDVPLTPLDPLFVLLWLLGVACALGAAVQAKFHRLAALMMVGAVGLVTCLTFAWFSAPDLALTQIVVETVTTVLILPGSCSVSCAIVKCARGSCRSQSICVIRMVLLYWRPSSPPHPEPSGPDFRPMANTSPCTSSTSRMSRDGFATSRIASSGLS
jgi:multicomponent K+:H+ antiporter subunit A